MLYQEHMLRVMASVKDPHNLIITGQLREVAKDLVSLNKPLKRGKHPYRNRWTQL